MIEWRIEMNLPPAGETPLFAILLYATAASGIVLLLGYAATFALRRPALRIKLTLATLAGALVSPLAGLIPGFPHLAFERRVEEVPSIAVESRPSFNSEPTATVTPFPEIARSQSPRSNPAIPRAADAPAADWRSIAIGAWLLGLCFSISWWLIGLFRLRRLLRSSSPATAEAQREFTSLAGNSSKVRLLESDRIAHPLACWWFRPTIVLPRGVAATSAEQLRWLLAHEWAHLAHGDASAWLFAQVARTLLYHQPLAWLLCRRLRFDQDLLADAAASDSGKSPADYASFLLEHARSPFSLQLQPTLGMAAGRTQLYRRVVMLLHHRQRLERTVTWKARLAIGLAAIGLVIAAGTLPLPQAIRGERQNVSRLAAQDITSNATKTESTTTVSNTPREKLRYAGKSFDVWKGVLETDLEPKTRIEAINALAAFGGKGYGVEVDGILAEVLASPDDEVVHLAAISACGKLGSNAFHSAKNGIKSKHEDVRKLAIDRLAAIETQRSLPLLLELIDSPELRVRIHACRIIGTYGPEAKAAAPQVLELAQKDDDENVRAAAYLALGKLGKPDEPMEAALLAAIEDDTSPVAAMAAISLLKHGVANDRVKQAFVEAFLQEDTVGPDSGKWRLDQLPKSDSAAEVVASVLEQMESRGPDSARTHFKSSNLLEWLVDYGPKASQSPLFVKWLNSRSAISAAEGLVQIGVTDQATKDAISRIAKSNLSGNPYGGRGPDEAQRWRAVLKRLER
jgi:beta-lactamase regulating signal transducer with metallopeptidase domain